MLGVPVGIQYDGKTQTKNTLRVCNVSRQSVFVDNGILATVFIKNDILNQLAALVCLWHTCSFGDYANVKERSTKFNIVNVTICSNASNLTPFQVCRVSIL